MATQQDLQMTPSEASGGAAGQAAYKARTAALYSPAPTPETPKESDSSKFLKSIQERLLGSSGAVSSADSGIDELFKEVISSTEKAGKATESGIKAAYERQRQELQGQLPEDVKTVTEARSGFATNMAVLKKLFQDTDKSLKDLDLREQEALSTGNAKMAESLANLKLQKLQFLQKAEQDTFQNLLSAANVSTNMDELALRKENASFDRMVTQFDFLSKNNLLNDIDPTQKRTLEAQFGLPTGVLDQVKKGEPLNLQRVDGVGLVNVTQDKNGNPQIKILVREQATPGSTSPTEAAYEKRISTARFLNNIAGDDGFVSATDYKKALSLYGGDVAGFKEEFPPELYLGSWERPKAPENLRSSDDDLSGLLGS